MRLMSKRTILIIVLIVAALGVVIAAFLFFGRLGKESKPTQQGSLFTEPFKKVLSQEETYQDEAGFSFKHPKGARVEEVNLEDDSVYSSLELTLSGKTGKLTIDLRDTTYKSVDDWLAKDRTAPKNAKISGETKLATFPAKQYTSSSGLLTVAIDQGVLYRIEAPGTSWEEVYDKIVSTFTLTAGSTSASSEANVIYEEEEIVE